METDRPVHVSSSSSTGVNIPVSSGIDTNLKQVEYTSDNATSMPANDGMVSVPVTTKNPISKPRVPVTISPTDTGPVNVHINSGNKKKRKRVSDQPQRKTKKNKATSMKQKKVMNPYIYFQVQYRKELYKSNPKMSFVEISKACSVKWKSMDESQKQPYRDQHIHARDTYEHNESRVSSTDS